jgi:hypothetical protein
MGPRTDQLRAARGIAGNGNVCHLGTNVRTAEVLFVDRGPLPYLHQAYQIQNCGKEYDFRIVFCTRSPESFEAAREERLKVSVNPSQYNDLSPFIRERELMRELTAKSMLPSLTLDISDNNIPAAVAWVADWLEQSGGLYMPD